ncbi:hypothetical protein [Aeromonas hydrophila]|uniref:hypothetical protein n=1 Tax=Aeromonas hydrophila TaxID=644 RepID=UPI00191CE344|nr:hypothetical protein [Aeromonas hydrophila]MBL0559282.1 hypothetical protein [Aeromonas hydrophila]
MKTLNIEIHYFLNKSPVITSAHAYRIMEELKEFELFPQIFQEASPSGGVEQRFMFTNGVTGLTIRCQRDRFLLIQGVNPNNMLSESTDLHDTLNRLSGMLSKFSATLNNVFATNFIFHRLAIVSRHIEIERYQEVLSKLLLSTTQELPWVESSTKELTLRTGHRFDAEGDKFNSIITISDGLMDLVSSNGISVNATPCILFEIDINSIPEINTDRFDAETTPKNITVIINKQIETLSEIKKHLEGN